MPDVATLERVAGKYEQLAYDRAEARHRLAYPFGLPSDPRETQHPKGLWFDGEAAEHVIQFVEGFCRHHKGEWAGRLLLLEEWQHFIVREMFGWRRPDGTRLVRVAYIEIPRKDGKSELAAALGLYLTIADGEPGAEVYSSATKKDQAKIVHDAATAMLKASAELQRFARSFRNNIHCPTLGSKFEPLGADSDTLDGLNAHGNIIDELHAHKDRGVWDVLDTSMGARRQPLTIAITTAGIYEPESIGWQQHDYAVKLLEGIFEDDSEFAFIAAADDEDDWRDPATWAKANPNLGVSVKHEFLAQQAEKAEKQPSFLNTFLRLHLNRWTQQRDRWIRIEDWNACEEPVDLDALAGQPCFGGLDLSSKLDLTALVLDFPRPGGFHDLVFRFWCPADTIQERKKKDRVPYDAWVRDGWLIATPGNVIDYDAVEAEVAILAARHEIREAAFDPWNAQSTATRLGASGLTMVEFRQGFQSMSEPAKEFEKLIIARHIRHGGHPVMRWMVANAAKREDPAGNIKPDKSAAADRIDGVVAAVMALGRAIVHPADEESVYQTQGITFL